jgi:hypothetical protein
VHQPKNELSPFWYPAEDHLLLVEAPSESSDPSREIDRSVPVTRLAVFRSLLLLVACASLVTTSVGAQSKPPIEKELLFESAPDARRRVEFPTCVGMIRLTSRPRSRKS